MLLLVLLLLLLRPLLRLLQLEAIKKHSPYLPTFQAFCLNPTGRGDVPTIFQPSFSGQVHLLMISSLVPATWPFPFCRGAPGSMVGNTSKILID